MKKTILPVSFFFGANNKNGYCSLYPGIYNPYEGGKHIILKGGPGTGKSTLMKKIAQKLVKEGYFIEHGFCSADPTSLDVVWAPEINFSILDGTSPHTFDPTLPGVSEHIVDLSVAWDKKYLSGHAREIGELTRKNKELHAKASDFLMVASQIDSQGVVLCNSFVDREKLERYAKRLAHRLVPERKGNARGRVHKRFLSGVTPEGIVTQYDTMVALSEKIVTIKDEYSAASPYIVSVVGEYAVDMGYDVYKCYCPLFPNFKAEHIIIPELKVALFTENAYHPSIDECGSRVHASRFFDKDAFSKNKEKLHFQKKAKKELIDEAVRKISLALDIHNRLEEYYIKATNFGVIDEMSERIMKI
ncbi:MAG: hypothetical protein IIX14_00080 [Clostridia bacterium]|nr:hypothetical protein [Clostridia bacterium]